MIGVIFDIKRFALHDGPGIRTTVFLKGCPLRCCWCHNPESQRFGVESRDVRNGCLAVGREVSVDEVVSEVTRDTPFYDESGGGVTFSGGEPLAQPEFLTEALKRCGELGLHRSVDTCGYAPREVLMSVAEHADLFLFDLKLTPQDAHVEHTGVEAQLIHDNLTALCYTPVPIQLRFPVIPGVTDTEENIEGIQRLRTSLPRELPLRLLPYHRAAMDKHVRFGMRPPLPDTPEPTGARMEELCHALDACN